MSNKNNSFVVQIWINEYKEANDIIWLYFDTILFLQNLKIINYIPWNFWNLIQLFISWQLVHFNPAYLFKIRMPLPSTDTIWDTKFSTTTSLGIQPNIHTIRIILATYPTGTASGWDTSIDAIYCLKKCCECYYESMHRWYLLFE